MKAILIYEKTLAEWKFRPNPMQVHAGGAIRPIEANEYLEKFHNIESVLFGASPYAHIKETKDLIENHLY